MSNEQHGADAVEPDHNSTDDQTPIEGADAAAGATTAPSGIIETAGAHAPVLDEATPDITDEGAADLANRTFADYGVSATFSDRTAYERYRDHPEHRRIVTEMVAPYLAARSGVQFEH